ncbi:MAG: Rod shape-determining protein mreB [Candidatus Azambacteria bacterium GW2011_GWB2_46_37]|uniref:Cell shape-determining protein MreB n=9 Tax=Candidatus Azamiibacteriota TaxID=1752741 RepID=A0A1F5C8J6_9BACT|nr:MAG: rod shape-determining protein MreB, rod shape-determining protein MreB [Candidatus Azambacteria bacterium GW2011_GWC1_46_13]KKU36122.1 MAG: Rod shape-determining protein mreB [Candidatus Azambacteria bacterium GW2011_GWB1_46_27]KKU37838.1 MAG: Rod shape-determining protein mreB [Candidatus Azambacteria bacterium GW2011_GWF2_46_32]KKU39217.1 MAG: Rod shape-determining protein mreB [Candidatus Azambacteria bacterium GW2011_GWB2_46_37]KKU40238.1 MAG: Rod shape-determining protein mreB [Can
MFNGFFGLFSKDIGIDLGTANTLVYVKGRGIVINEPSVVAVNQKTGQVLAIGSEAKKMVGRTPAHIVATRPLVAGVISDFEVTEQMLRYFFEKVHKESFSILPRPRVVIGIPTGVTEVEKRAVEDAARNAGAREVYLIEEPMAAAIGARLPVQEPIGNMIVDIGGGTTDVALISLGGIVTSRSLRIAGDKLSDDIVRYARDEFKLLLGERTAEEIKIGIGSAHELNEELGMPMRGRDLISGLPKEVIVNDFQIRKAMSHSVQLLVNAIKSAVEETPPELLADVMNRGIILAGGGSLLRGLDRLISEETKIPVKIAEDPLTAVVRGTGVVLEDIDALNEVLVTTQYEKAPSW